MKNLLASSFALIAGLCAFAEEDWRIVAADQGLPGAVIIDGRSGASNILWRWSAKTDPHVKPEDWKYFLAIDECKVVDFGSTLMINASCGGVAAIDIATTNVLWYAKATRGGAGSHSLCYLPDGRVAVANSSGCDALEIIDVREHPFDPAKQKIVRAADVWGAHGVSWHASRHSLFVLGYTNLIEFAYLPESMAVKELRRWNYEDVAGDAYGHDLVPDTKGGYFITNHSGVWRFDPETGTFTSVAPIFNVKSFSRDSRKGDLLQIPTERWWSNRLIVVNPDGTRRLVGPFPGAKYYKARWFTGDTRKLVWADEFNGTTLDTNRWVKCTTGWCPWNRYMSNRPDLVAVSNGWLVMTGVKNANTNDDPRPYLTGGVKSPKKGVMRLGKVEMRVKFEDHQKGTWPALWMLSDVKDDLGRGWPWNGEIDIVERLNDDPFVYHTTHSAWTYTKKRPFPVQGGKGAMKKGEWNVYGLEILPDALVWSVNGEETFRYARYVETGDIDHWPYRNPFYFLLDMQLGGEGEWAGPIESKTLPVRMYIDWIRVYE